MNQKPFFKLNEPLSEPELAKAQSTTLLGLNQAIELLSAPEKANPFVKFFAEMAIVQDFDQLADTKTPQYFKNTEAAVTGIKSTSNDATPIALIR